MHVNRHNSSLLCNDILPIFQYFETGCSSPRLLCWSTYGTNMGLMRTAKFVVTKALRMLSCIGLKPSRSARSV